MEYNIPIKEDGLYNAILLIMDPILNLSNQERHTLVQVLKTGYPFITTETREYLREVTGMNTFNLNNNIKRLKDKQILVPVAKRVLAINENILLMVSEPRLTINFVKANDTRENSTGTNDQVSPEKTTSTGHTGVTE
jgi:hypothetical protein